MTMAVAVARGAIMRMLNTWPPIGCVLLVGALAQLVEPDGSGVVVAGGGDSLPSGGRSADPRLDEIQQDDRLLDVYGLSGFQHEFKIEVTAGGSECFFQMLEHPATLHVAFEVLRGADRNIDFRIRDSAKNLIGNFEWTKEGNIEHNVTTTGIYQFCIDNSLSRFSSKLVYLYFMSFNELDWNRYVTNFQDFFGGADNVLKSLEKFDQQISKVLVLQATSRRHLATDWYIIRSNNAYVQQLSIAMCAIVLLASVFQVMFVRRLFNTSPKVKPHA